MLGVLVVARGQVFIGAAMAQASTLGVATATWLGAASVGGLLTAGAMQTTLGVLTCIAAAMLLMRQPRSSRPGRGEEVTAWLFVGAAAMTVLLLAHHPLGMKQIQRLLASSVIGASRMDVIMFSTLAPLTALLLLGAGRRLVLLIADPVMAAAVGMRLWLWNTAIAVGVGLGVGLAIGSSGLLYSFGCLVLPALIARHLCTQIRPMFWVSPLIAAVTSATGLFVAHTWNYPPGQMVVVLLCCGLVVAWAVIEVRERMLAT